jgi:hypothetical protein
VICGLPQAISRDLRAATKVCNGGQRVNFYLYSEDFSEIVAFKGTIRKILNIV